MTHPSSSAVVPDINPAVSMPDRITTGAGTGYSQMMISQYMIQSYYNALMIKYPYYLVDDVPSNFPNILDTNSGYYPELLKTYGSTAVNLNISFPTAPQIVIIPSIGLKVKVISNVQVLAYNSQLNQ